MSQESPFTITRFEYEQSHLYYLPQTIFSELENPISTYLVGSRGTGKTTLLKALNWQERIQNSSLQQQLKGALFSRRYIGIYLKLPEIQLGVFDEWLSKKDTGLYGSTLGLFFDLIWLELIADAVADLTVRNILLGKPSQEHACIENVVVKHSDVLREHLPTKGPFTVKQFAAAIGSLKRDLERLAILKGDPKEIVDRFPVGQVGSFGRFASRSLAEFCDMGLAAKEKGWHFKICMDEGECLNLFQQRVLNTAIRLGEWPAFFVVAFVSLPEDPITTLIPHLTIQKADCRLQNIDEMEDAVFRDLATGVATVRVRTGLGDEDATLDIDRILGPLDVNGLLQDILEDSVRPEAQKLLQDARELARHPFFASRANASEMASEAGVRGQHVPPIYQAYLIQNLDLKLPSPDKPDWERRRQDSAELRKRIVAAYLSICHELGADVRYASAEMLLQMSDKCIRDFLSQVEEVFRQKGSSLAEFLVQTISRSDQDSALKRASRNKKESLPKSGVRAPIETGRIVDALAKITAIVQSRGRGHQHLLSSERGLFEVQCEPSIEQSVLVQLVDSAEAGFLKIILAEGRTRKFRVHTSLAAAYGFSYRGAYYATRLPLSDIARIAKTDDPNDLTSLVAEIGNRLAGQDAEDLPLFKGPTR